MGATSGNRELTFEDIFRIVAPIAKKHGVLSMYLFGSRARGEEDCESDFDFCVAVPDEYTLMDLGSLLNDLEIALEKNVDIVCEDDLPRRPSFMEEVMHDRRAVFET
ncbi:MAG: nucleotidyltransferase domain-containing protein [Candidatus Methanoplasma sp.]|jgi:predicted nucleotidyltransferase|nr:nucleotidyltransferase domain-containing protein [Candidatus Methanoplasma sp.]